MKVTFVETGSPGCYYNYKSLKVNSQSNAS